MIKKIGLILIAFTLLVLFFSYKLAEVPRGLTLDESAFGYNAVLLGNTLRDQNGRFLPIFVLSLDGRDWRQPVSQYFIAAYFKVMGPSVYNLKFTSVLVAVVSTLLIFYLGYLLLGVRGGLITGLLFITTPILMIQAHLGLDNIMPVPFTIVWLMGVLLYVKTSSLKWLILSALSLGIGFYSYKGMRSAVPVWTVLSLFYLVWVVRGMGVKRALKPLLTFILTILPFYAIIPFLEWKYAGAVFDRNAFKLTSVYDFLYPYFSSFDLSFLLIKGDPIAHHSTGRHGMFLLASIAPFIIGLGRVMKMDKFWLLILLSFFLAPLLFGFAQSVHRASRLTFLIPSYSLISGLGGYWLLANWKNKLLRWVLVGIVGLMLVNYLDFIDYYWNRYAADTAPIFYKENMGEPYRVLKAEADKSGFKIYMDQEILKPKRDSDTEMFLRSIYFPQFPPGWFGEELPKGSILLTDKGNLVGLQKLEIKLPFYHIYVKPF